MPDSALRQSLESDLSDLQLLRYNRQIMLPAIGIEGQERLLASRILLVGLGGLGSPIAMYLAACGIGRLTLADHDHVELANLQRQILYGTSDLDRPKAVTAKQALQEINPEIRIKALADSMRSPLLDEQVRDADLVIDATDNFETRLAINRACVAYAKTLVSGAVIRMEGQVAVFRNRQPQDACYQCLFGDDPVPEEGCAESGVLGPVAGAVGCVQAAEAIKCLASAGEPLYNRLMLYDAMQADWRVIELAADPHCPICRAVWN